MSISMAFAKIAQGKSVHSGWIFLWSLCSPSMTIKCHRLSVVSNDQYGERAFVVMVWSVFVVLLCCPPAGRSPLLRFFRSHLFFPSLLFPPSFCSSSTLAAMKQGNTSLLVNSSIFMGGSWRGGVQGVQCGRQGRVRNDAYVKVCR